MIEFKKMRRGNNSEEGFIMRGSKFDPSHYPATAMFHGSPDSPCAFIPYMRPRGAEDGFVIPKSQIEVRQSEERRTGGWSEGCPVP